MDIKTFEVVQLSKKQKIIWNIFGWIIFPIALFFMYSTFFEREDYLTRKKFYHYLKSNSLDSFEDAVFINYYFCNLNEKIILFVEKDFYDFFLSDIATYKCLLSTFHKGILDDYYYKKIKNILFNSIQPINAKKELQQ